MRAIQSIEALNIPTAYREYISEYIQNISSVPFIGKVILFGSCANDSVTRYSDIDIFIITNREITDDEEAIVTFHCLPDYSVNTLPIDIIVQSANNFLNNTNNESMIQRQVNKHGVDISGLLR